MSSRMILWTSSKHIHWWMRLYLPLSIGPGSWERWSGMYLQVDSCPHRSCQVVLISLLRILSNSVNILGVLGMNPARSDGSTEQMLQNSLSSFQDRKKPQPFPTTLCWNGILKEMLCGEGWPPCWLMGQCLRQLCSKLWARISRQPRDMYTGYKHACQDMFTGYEDVCWDMYWYVLMFTEVYTQK